MKSVARPAASSDRGESASAIVVGAAAVCVSGILLLGGCATPAKPANMAVPAGEAPQAAADSALRYGIAVVAVGGGEAPSRDMTYSTVGAAELEQALRESLRRYGYLSARDADAPLRLNAFLLSLRRPHRGFTMTATSQVRYKMSRAVDGKVVYDDIVQASATLTVDDEFMGVSRDRMVLETAIRRNIAQFLRVLYTLDAK